MIKQGDQGIKQYSKYWKNAKTKAYGEKAKETYERLSKKYK